MIVTAISDLHGFRPELPGGDLLIVAGDLTATHEISEYVQFGAWLDAQKYKRKLLVAGNHDNQFVDWPGQFIIDVDYLCDSGTEFEGLKIWGSPWTRAFRSMNPKCKAFTVGTDEALQDKWALIPLDTDILITHTPAHRVGDKIRGGKNVGSRSLYSWMLYGGRPRLHVFGHVHEGYGKHKVFNLPDDQMVLSINASLMNELYEPVNEPITVEI